MQFAWRWDSGTIPLNLGAIWEMSAQIEHMAHAVIVKRRFAEGATGFGQKKWPQTPGLVDRLSMHRGKESENGRI